MRLLAYTAGFGGGKAARGSRHFFGYIVILAFEAGPQYRERAPPTPNAAAGPFLPGALKIGRWPHGVGQTVELIPSHAEIIKATEPAA